jgi:hypothetical protein
MESTKNLFHKIRPLPIVVVNDACVSPVESFMNVTTTSCFRNKKCHIRLKATLGVCGPIPGEKSVVVHAARSWSGDQNKLRCKFVF